MEKLIERLFKKYSVKGINIFTEKNARVMIEKSCEAQRKACLRRLIETADNCDFRTTLRDAVATARITEQDYD